MAKAPRDPLTLDLLSWRPKEPMTPVVPAPARSVEPEGWRLAERISLSVAGALRESDMPRDEVARRMSEFLGEDVSAHMLSAYASQARDDHNISFARLVALSHALGRLDLLDTGARLLGSAVVDQRYLPAIEEMILIDEIEEREQRRKQLRPKWRGR
ncbi:DNA transposition protein [Thalassobaculum litoreum]|uniref:DNA transposition protein n=1 Tax=Thalassobaculum litoreum DSM 18839 TaxID=1123362 RepID=A0A8G2F5X6_9PROT|nr:DNA transposition protein [Thalassobaculum litoreum]SDG61487.1 hypothetical protein SAMN05660686_05023 [Thalassobaculum litoreum DSM 18839]